MIKVALKHWIYELCIEQLFNGVAKNFSSSNNVPILEEGGFYSEIYLDDGEVLTGVRVTRIYIATEGWGNVGEKRIDMSYDDDSDTDAPMYSIVKVIK